MCNFETHLVICAILIYKTLKFVRARLLYSCQRGNKQIPEINTVNLSFLEVREICEFD